MSQLHTASRKVMIKYVGPVVIYKIIELHNYLLKILEDKIIFITSQRINLKYAFVHKEKTD